MIQTAEGALDEVQSMMQRNARTWPSRPRQNNTADGAKQHFNLELKQLGQESRQHLDAHQFNGRRAGWFAGDRNR